MLNKKRLQRYYEKRDNFRDALETIGAEYPRLLLKVEQRQKKFNWKSLILQFIP